MENHGLSEDQTAYDAEGYKQLVGQVRRWGPAGPAYEVMSVSDDGTAICEVIYSGEKVSCPVSEVLMDPIAETIP